MLLEYNVWGIVKLASTVPVGIEKRRTPCGVVRPFFTVFCGKKNVCMMRCCMKQYGNSNLNLGCQVQNAGP